MAELKPGDRVLVPAEVDEVTPDYIYMRKFGDQFHPSEVIPAGDALTGELRFLREREAHFARVLGIPDGGRYRNDWDATLEVVRKIATLRQHGHISLELAENSTLARLDEACDALDALADLLPTEDQG